MPKITAAARDLLEAIAAGNVTGSYRDDPSSWYSAAVPVLDGFHLTAFDLFDPARNRTYTVTSRVCDLFSAGLATAEAGTITEMPAVVALGYVADNGKSRRHMHVAVVLTDAGREALGLEPAAPAAPTPGPAAGSPALEGEGAGPAAFGAGASGGTFAGLIITGPAIADALRHAEAAQRRAVLGAPAPAAPTAGGPWPKYGMCRFCNKAVCQGAEGELWAVRGPLGEDLVYCADAPSTPTTAEMRHEPAAWAGLSPAPIPMRLDVADFHALGAGVATATPSPATDDAGGWPKYSTCRFCRHTMRMDGPGEPWTVHGPAGTTYTQCSDAPNPEDGPMPPHEPGTAVLSPPAADAAPDAPADPTSLGTTPPPIPWIPRQ